MIDTPTIKGLPSYASLVGFLDDRCFYIDDVPYFIENIKLERWARRDCMHDFYSRRFTGEVRTTSGRMAYASGGHGYELERLYDCFIDACLDKAKTLHQLENHK